LQSGEDGFTTCVYSSKLCYYGNMCLSQRNIRNGSLTQAIVGGDTTDLESLYLYDIFLVRFDTINSYF
jgi:hypothetical protein